MSTLFEDLLFMAEPSYEDYFNLDSLGYQTYSGAQVQQVNDPISPKSEGGMRSIKESQTPKLEEYCPKISMGTGIGKKKRVRTVTQFETKNITKFFGSRLQIFLTQELEHLKQLGECVSKDQRLLKKLKCSTIKSLRQLWLQSQNLKALSQRYFTSEQPVIAALQSDRIDSASVAVKFIRSYLKGIQNPDDFVKLNWENKRI